MRQSKKVSKSKTKKHDYFSTSEKPKLPLDTVKKETNLRTEKKNEDGHEILTLL